MGPLGVDGRQAAKSGAFKGGQPASATAAGYATEAKPQAPPRPKGLRSTGDCLFQKI